MMMRTRYFLIPAAIIALSSQAHAGFEWLPPAQNPAQISQPAPSLPNAPIMAAPAPTVLSEPLSDNMMAPVTAPISPQISQNSSGKLYINPYPLNSNNVATPTSSQIDQTMMEQSHQLNPVQLGSGMTSGTKPYQVTANVPRAPSPSSMRKDRQPIGMGIGALTPMMDGEPAPLPTVQRASLANISNTAQNKNFAQAVGFGKELPLALAISQVVPSEYTHRFDGNIDPSAKVSWQGGKPWNIVLQDMLRAENLNADIQGNVVVIR